MDGYISYIIYNYIFPSDQKHFKEYKITALCKKIFYGLILLQYNIEISPSHQPL